jgi:cystathionine beta-synthase
MAVHAALQVAAGIDDPEALVAVVLPDGGRSYLSQIYSDAWMTQHGFLERRGDGTVGDALAAKQQDGNVPPLVTVTSNQKVRDAIALLHEHGVSQLPVVSAHDPQSVVGSIGERGLLKQAVGTPELLDAEVVHAMEAPFPAVAAGDPVREAVELLAGERQALLVLDEGRPAGILTRADLLETLAR